VSLVFVLLILAVVGAVAAVATGRIAGGLDAPASSLPSRGLPPGDVSADDLGAVRFAPALRGYRMDQVDAVLDRLADELARRDAELRRLRGRPDLEPVADAVFTDPALADPLIREPVFREPARAEPMFTDPARADRYPRTDRTDPPGTD